MTHAEAVELVCNAAVYTLERASDVDAWELYQAIQIVHGNRAASDDLEYTSK